jgi:hypothetical protein
LATATRTAKTTSSGDWTRRYPPLLSVAVALIIALAVLPSSLNLPQTNPSQTLEFAPVPPDDEVDTTPPEGNFDQLGLGSSEGIDGDGALGGDGPGGPPDLPPPAADLIAGTGDRPSTVRCVIVDGEARQTEDPLAPPCVAFFDGDNFGATYQGVTEDEIQLLVYFDGGIRYTGTSDGFADTPDRTYYDLIADPPDTDEHFYVTAMRVWQRYFNERFQTYNRTVRFHVYFGGLGAAARTPEARRADAADNFNRIRPFAVLTYASDNEDAYIEYMAQRGVLNFGSLFGRPASLFDRFPNLIWGLQPSLEQQVEQYASYVCQKVVPEPAALTGVSPGGSGSPRKIGMIHTSDESFAGLLLLADEVKRRVRACGGEIEVVGTFPNCCYAKDNSITHEYATQQMIEFQQAGISTILWPGGINGYYGPAADNLNYRPEWVVLGDGTMEGNNPIRLATLANAFHGRGFIVTPVTYQPDLRQQRCYQAFREYDQTMPHPELGFACDQYSNLFQVFTGIQVAGPRLGPTSISQGFHAIPPRRSTDPGMAACFYLPNDYTCIKDAQVLVYDRDGQAPGDSRPGCWRAIESGQRYLPGEWPRGNINAQMPGGQMNPANQPCSGFNTGVLLQTL